MAKLLDIDRFDTISLRGQKSILMEYGVYHDIVMPFLDVDNYSVLYTEEGRSPSNLRYLIMAVFLREKLHCSQEELIMSLDCNIGCQYAMGTTKREKQPVSERNLQYFYERLRNYAEATGTNLIENTAMSISHEMARLMGFNIDKYADGDVLLTRMDSMMIAGSAARLNRTGILYVTNQRALDLYASLVGQSDVPPQLHHYYVEDDRNAVIYHNKGNLMDKLQVLLDENLLIQKLMTDEAWKGFSAVVNLKRVFDDQSKVDGKNPEKFVPKENNEIEGSSLQSPIDPLETARTKARQTYVGYCGNFKEAYDMKGHSVIISADIQDNLYTDIQYAKDEIEKRTKAGGPVEQCVHDGAFFNTSILEPASEAGIILIPTALTAGITNPLYGNFVLSKDGKTVENCPNGHSPMTQYFSESKGKIVAKFDKGKCAICPYAFTCPNECQSRAIKVEVNENLVIRGEYTASFDYEEHKRVARYRNGVEAIPSIMRRVYRIDDLATMDSSTRRTRFFACILCYNCQKYAKFMRDSEKTAAA